MVALAWVALAGAIPASAQVAITTFHYDNYRTGWNSKETALTPAKVSSGQFGLMYTTTLDDQVDAQPLVMPSVMITTGPSKGSVHKVVYVATENNTVYAIGQNTGIVLVKRNLGTPVPTPLGCHNNGPNVGINSTPVIDANTNTLYVIAYTQDANGPTYRIHALDLGNLTDKVQPVVITASHTLTDGTTYTFNATYQRQRPGLLLANGNIYAGFGSFCDFGAQFSRGWLLGWTVDTLTPLATNQLIDVQATSPKTFFLSSIWMSGYAPAADDAGNVLFVTGNSDPSGTTYDGITNIQESVVKMSPTLSTVNDVFTPMNQAQLEATDGDFGSGGVMVLPDQPGSLPHLAVAAGKFGNLYLLNEDALGGYSTTKDNVLGTYQIGGCWCGESYFVDPTDGLARVVTSAGRKAKVWKLSTTPSPSLKLTKTSAGLTGGQDPGFFTTVSSNGNKNPIVWALSRAVETSPYPIYLYAFNPEATGATMTTLFSGVVGSWPSINGNANLVPVVANGEVFIATYKQLQIWGIKPPTGTVKK